MTELTKLTESTNSHLFILQIPQILSKKRIPVFIFKTEGAIFKTAVVTFKTTVSTFKTTVSNFKTTVSTFKTTVSTFKTAVSTFKTAVLKIKTAVALSETTQPPKEREPSLRGTKQSPIRPYIFVLWAIASFLAMTTSFFKTVVSTVVSLANCSEQSFMSGFEPAAIRHSARLSFLKTIVIVHQIAR
jgi:hypothetical protein